MKKLFSALTLVLLIPTQALAYDDVDGKGIYDAAIDYLTDKDVIHGDSSTNTFRPTDRLNRAEITKIIVEAVTDEDLSAYNTACFSDIPANEWYTSYICYAKAQGWVSGFLDGNFRPQQPVTFAEGLKIAFEGWDLEYEKTTDLWFRGLINAANRKNYIPIDITAFESDLRREQMADLITRILKDREETLSQYLGVREQYRVSFESIATGEDLYEEMSYTLAVNEVLCMLLQVDNLFAPEVDEEADAIYRKYGFDPDNIDHIIALREKYENRKRFQDKQEATFESCGGDWYQDLRDSLEEAELEPQMSLAPTTGDTIAILETSMGDITMILYREEAPVTTQNFIDLAQDDKYDGAIFHRVIDDFMIQGGDFENGNGTGGHSAEGPGTFFDDEFVDHLVHVRGAVSMANSGPDTNGSQFFIVQKPEGTEWLDGHHSVFGFVYEGMDVVDQIASVDTNANERPNTDVIIEDIRIELFIGND